MANGILGTNTDILYVNAGGAGDYSGASGVFVDNVNRVISLTGDYASAIPQISANSANIAELSSKFEDCCSSVQGDITNLSSSITNLSGDVINKLDISSFSAVSGNFLTAMPQGVMYEDRLNYTDDLSALSGYNGIPFVGSNSPSDGYELIEGSYVQLTDNSANKTTEISVTGLQPAGDYVTNTDLENVSSFLSASIDYVSAHAGGGGGSTSADYELIEGDYIQLLDNSANKTTQINVTGLPNFSDYASTGDLNALSSLVDNLSGDVVSISSTVSSSVTSLSSDIQYVSANCLTAHQSLDDYYKKTETSSKQEISAALASLQPGDAEVNQVVHTYSAEGKWLIASDLDPYLQKSESGNFYPMTGNPSGFLTSETDWTNTIKEASANAYNEAVAQIPAPFDPTYLSGEVDKKLDKSFSSNFYPMTGNPSGFLTAHQSLAGYATTAQVDSVSSLLSAGLDYVSAQGGKTYNGVAPIQVNNDENLISADAVELTAGNGLRLADYVIEVTADYALRSEVSSLSGNFYSASNPSAFITSGEFNSISSMFSGAIDYVSANASLSPSQVILTGNNIGKNFTLSWAADMPGAKVTPGYVGVSGQPGVGNEVDVAVSLMNLNGTVTTHKLTEKLNATATAGFVSTATLNSVSSNLSGGITYLSGAVDYVSANGGKTYTGVAPIQVNNTTNEISITGKSLSAGPNIDIFSSGGYVVISANSGSEGKIYTGIAPITVNNSTNQISVTANELSAGPGIDIFTTGGYIAISAQGGGSNFAGEGSFFNDDVQVEKNLSGVGFYEQANYRGSYQILGSADDGTWHGYGYTMSLPEGVLLSDINASASTFALSAVSSLVRPMVYADITFSAVRDTFRAGGIVIPYEVNQGYSTVYDYVGSSVNGSYSSYNFHNLQFNGYGTVLTISSYNDGATTGILKHSDRYFASPSDVAAVDRIVLVPTSGDIPASGSSDNKVYIVTGTV